MAQGKVTITQSVDKDQLDRLVKVVLELESRVLELESDVYGMRRENTETRRRLSDLESSKRMPRMPPF